MPSSTVIAAQQRDYPAWHLGRPFFSLWYIEIQHAQVVDYCWHLRRHFADFLLPDWQRQFHITLFVNGFFQPRVQYADDFSPQQLIQQITALRRASLPKFTLTLGKIVNLGNVLCVQVQPQPILHEIRRILYRTGQEIDPATYYPHITLGLYRQNFVWQQIQQRAALITTPALSLPVEHLHFGVYHAKQLQGRLFSVYPLDLQ